MRMPALDKEGGKEIAACPFCARRIVVEIRDGKLMVRKPIVISD